MVKKKTSFLLLPILAFLCLFLAPTPTPAEDGCYEGVMVWDWTYWEWRCSLSNGGGQVCILCFDEIDAERPWDQDPPT